MVGHMAQKLKPDDWHRRELMISIEFDKFPINWRWSCGFTAAAEWQRMVEDSRANYIPRWCLRFWRVDVRWCWGR